jgi:hypothetical protein
MYPDTLNTLETPRVDMPFFILKKRYASVLTKEVPVIVTAGERFLAEDHSSARPSRQDKTKRRS